MKVRARLTRRDTQRDDALTNLDASIDSPEWAGWEPVGKINLISKYDKGTHWIAPAYLERELT